MDIKDRLKEAMARNGINSRELSRLSNLNEASISRYLAGKMEPKLDAVVKLARALHVSPDWLMGIESDVERPDYSLQTEKIAMLIDCMSVSEKSEVERFVKYIITSRGGSDDART